VTASRTRRALLAALVVACLSAAAPATPPDATKIRELTSEEVVGRIEALKGSVVVVHVWATWCPPCVKEFPDVMKVAKKYAAGGKVKILALSADEDEDALREFVARYKGVPAEVIRIADPKELAPSLRGAGIRIGRGVPFTAVLGPNGRSVTQWTGAETADAYTEAIDRALRTVRAARP
jgi:thiol-disulfide isomerase/thioredoxin